MKQLLLIVSVLLLTGCVVSVNSGTGDGNSARYLQAPGTEDMNLPFSSAVRAGDTLYLSGQLGIVPGTSELAEGGIGPETLQTMQNISRTLNDFDSSMDDVVKCTVFLADMSEWAAMNQVYKTFFRNPPARSAIAASGLALDGRVEIECIAYIG